MPKRKCKQCSERKERESMLITPLAAFCSSDCAIKHSNYLQRKAREKAVKKQASKQKAENKAWTDETSRRKEAAKKRTGPKGHYEPLKKSLHKYIKHGIRKGEDCYTCGLKQRFEDKPQAFHVGHYMPAKMVDPRRFMIDQLRIQCYSCNAANSGRQSIFRQKLIEERGLEWVEWLECEVNHPSLKEQYPEVSDIKAAAAGYRKKLRDILA